MKLLNARVKFLDVLKTYHAPAQAVGWNIGGRTFLLDSNSLAVWELEEEGEKPPLCEVKPQFPLSYVDVGSIVLECCWACNFRCKYCFASEYESRTAFMDLDMAKRAIRMLFNTRSSPGRRGFNIGFFGGEPLMNYKLIRQVVEFAKDALDPHKVRFSVTTNGSLITPTKAAFLAENEFSFIVSLDGPKHLHDKLRVYGDGRGTFDDVMKGLTVLKEHRPRTATLRATFSPGDEHILERVRFLNDLCDEGYGAGVAVEPVCLTESHCVKDEVDGYTPKTAWDLEGQYMEVADYAIDRIFSGKPFRFKNLEVAIRRLLYTHHNPSECGAGNGYLSVDHRGGIWACHRMNWGRIGHILKGGVDEEARAPWRDNRLYVRPKCCECGIRWVCGGGCREAALGQNKTVTIPYDVGCMFFHLFVKAAIWVMANVPKERLIEAFPNPLEKRKKDESEENRVDSGSRRVRGHSMCRRDCPSNKEGGA